MTKPKRLLRRPVNKPAKPPIALNCLCDLKGQPILRLTVDHEFYLQCRWCRKTTANYDTPLKALTEWNETNKPDEYTVCDDGLFNYHDLFKGRTKF